MTQAEAQAQLDAWLAASLALAQGRSASIGDKTLTLESWDSVQKAIAFWQKTVQQFASSNRDFNIRVTTWNSGWNS